MANGLSQDIGLQHGQPLRAHDKGRSDKKAHPPGFKFKGVQRCANQVKGYLATNIIRITVAVPTY